ncbi:MAG: histidinol dehydrogenase [Rhodospirillaceae bacterium]|nr:histidinol dehydrogenase [Rhodospirillaceae bacterium]|tara:strand:- start:142959 stop:144257 length:1299 start_codon:yes stop_codon:yes gene_type:complete
MATKIKFSDSDFADRIDQLVNARRDTPADVDGVVAEILDDVRKRGDEALLEYTKKFDRLSLATPADMLVTGAEIEQARSSCNNATIAALEHAAARIEIYHKKQVPEGFDFTDEDGVRLGSRWTPISAAGLYVPGGTAAYPSSVLMNAIPANVAGVDRLVMVVPTPDGILNPLVLAAADIAGVKEIYRIGGAQAVAALAYGTDTIAPVDKIVGPGNAYVAAAKRRVFGTVGIDMIAGPSEILVIADSSNDPNWIAADLLSQAEHDTDAQSILICDDEVFAESVISAVDDQLDKLPRADIARESWQTHGAVIVVEKLENAIPIIDRLAAEHLELAIADADEFAKKIRNAGAIFLGRYTPEAIGDYIAGPSHVLPTSRSAKFSSGLGVPDFLKRTSIIECNVDSASKITQSAEILAEEEGLNAHALSLAIRHLKP